MDHSYEEIRSVALDILAGREKTEDEVTQIGFLKREVAIVFLKRENDKPNRHEIGSAHLSPADANKLLEIFWSLFREGVITLGVNYSNPEYPFFRISEFGKKILEGGQAYFFHDVSSYEKEIRKEIPDIDEVTLIYLKEAMQAFKSGCILSSTVMLGVATEHTFLLLIENICNNKKYAAAFSNVNKIYSISRKVNKFNNILKQQTDLPDEIKEDLETQFAAILSVIRHCRNDSGHPTGKIIDREYAYVLLQLFILYCKKMYQLMDYFSNSR